MRLIPFCVTEKEDGNMTGWTTGHLDTGTEQKMSLRISILRISSETLGSGLIRASPVDPSVAVAGAVEERVAYVPFINCRDCASLRIHWA